MALFEIVCESCERVIGAADSINDAIEQAQREGTQRDPFWDNSGEWFCDGCAEAAQARRYSGDPAREGNDPVTDYFRTKEPWNYH